MRTVVFFVAILSISVTSMSAFAASLFETEVTIPEQGAVSNQQAVTTAVTDRLEFDDIEEILNQDFSEINNAYNPTDLANPVRAARAVGSYRGVIATLEYAQNSNTLVFEVPSANLREEFTGATRRESEELLEEYLKTHASDFLKAAVADTPNDPVAGNPNSLMGRMAVSDFGIATDIGPGAETEDYAATSEEGQEIDPFRVAIGLTYEYGHYESNDFETDVQTLPLSTSFGIGTKGYRVLLSAPISLINVDGAQAYHGSVGLGFQVPVFGTWRLTPSFRYGAVGSYELGSISGLYSGSLSSAFSLTMKDFGVELYDGDRLTLKVGNMVGFYKSHSIDVGDYSLDYNLTNYVFRNGVAFNTHLPIDVFGSPLELEIYGVNTHFEGDELFVQTSNEVGAVFGSALPVLSRVRGGIAYTFGDNYSGIKVTAGMKF